VVTLRDLCPLKRNGEYLRTGVRFRLRYMAVQRAARVIVPTWAVAEDAVEHLGLAPGRISVIPEAAAASMTPASAEQVADVLRRYALPERYLVWVGALERPNPRKRIAALADTPRELPLVLVGPAKQWAHELPDVTLTGRVTDADLAAIYTGAHALVLASDDEGFGLPAVEALACGTPVAACDVPALREVLGDRATFVPRDDLGGLVAAAAAARRPAPAPPPWTWADAARATCEVYESACDEAR
jgi:glycosyltransferase involved in cell wall biosynthesis